MNVIEAARAMKEGKMVRRENKFGEVRLSRSMSGRICDRLNYTAVFYDEDLLADDYEVVKE